MKWTSAEYRLLTVPWVVLFVFVVVPLYVVSAAFLWRAQLFDFRGPVTPNQFKSILAFLGASLAATATIMAALLTRSHNARTLSFQKSVEDQARLTKEADSERLTLDTVVRGLELLSADGGYAPQAKVAGALATLVHLGHPQIAMLALAAAWGDHKVDADTGCWLISQTLRLGDTRASVEASSLLLQHARDLPISDQPGPLSWPDIFWLSWPLDLPLGARLSALQALGEAALSRPWAWWAGHVDNFVEISRLAMTAETDNAVKHAAAGMFQVFTRQYAPTAIWDAGWTSTPQPIVALQANAKLIIASRSITNPRLEHLVTRLSTWNNDDSGE